MKCILLLTALLFFSGEVFTQGLNPFTIQNYTNLIIRYGLQVNNESTELGDIFLLPGKFGIGDSEPIRKFHISGNEMETFEKEFVLIENKDNSHVSEVWMKLISGTDDNLAFGKIAVTGNSYTAIEGYSGQTLIDNLGNGIILRSLGENDPCIKFVLGGFELSQFEKMRLTSEGHLGIGTQNPLAKLHVTDGDIFISDINKGVIMKSPDGQCWRVSVNNMGGLETGSIVCPN